MKKILIGIFVILLLLLAPNVEAQGWLNTSNWTTNDTTNFAITAPNSTCGCVQAGASTNITVTTTGLKINQTGAIYVNASFNVTNSGAAARQVIVNGSYPISVWDNATVQVFFRTNGSRITTSTSNSTTRAFNFTTALGASERLYYNVEFNLSFRPNASFLNTSNNYYNFIVDENQNDVNLSNVSYWLIYNGLWAVLNDTVEGRFYENSSGAGYREVTGSAYTIYNYTLDQVNDNMSFVVPSFNSTRFFRAFGWRENDVPTGGGGGGVGGGGYIPTTSFVPEVTVITPPAEVPSVEPFIPPGEKGSLIPGIVFIGAFAFLAYVLYVKWFRK